jgi:hypothetical protein
MQEFRFQKFKFLTFTTNCCFLKRIFLLLVLVYFGFTNGYAQVASEAVGARYLALGAYSSHNVDIYATRANPASLAQLKQAAVAVYGERRFELENLNLYTASVGLPTNSGNFAVHGSYFGFNLSNQTQLSLAYGRKITDKVDVGAAFHYQQISQAGIYGKANAITGSVGLLLHLTDKIHAGINAYNPIRAAYDKDKEERLPSQYSLGIGYDASDNFFVSAEIVKSEGHNVNVNAGFQYQFVKQFFVRMGIATFTSNYFAGLGFRLKDFRLDIASSYHPQLGFSPGLLLLYEFGKKKTATAE